MQTKTYSKINRGWLLRQAKAGRVWVKCNFHLTDDYAADAANDSPAGGPVTAGLSGRADGRNAEHTGESHDE